MRLYVSVLPCLKWKRILVRRWCDRLQTGHFFCNAGATAESLIITWRIATVGQDWNRQLDSCNSPTFEAAATSQGGSIFGRTFRGTILVKARARALSAADWTWRYSRRIVNWWDTFHPLRNFAIRQYFGETNQHTNSEIVLTASDVLFFSTLSATGRCQLLYGTRTWDLQTKFRLSTTLKVN